MHLEKGYKMLIRNIEHRASSTEQYNQNIEHRASSIEQFNKYQKIKSMQSFRQKFSEMIQEYRNGFRLQTNSEKAK